MRSKIIIVSVLVILGGIFLYSWNNRSLSGTYIVQDSNSVGMIRLVETDHGKLTGQLENVQLDNDGKIQSSTAVLEGATDGKNINLTLSLSPLQPIPITASGTRVGNNIVLTLGISGKFPVTGTLVKSDIETFEAAANNLDKKSEDILANKATEKEEKTKEDFSSKVKNLDSQLRYTNQSMDKISKALANADSQYHHITSIVRSGYNKAKSISGNQYAVTRSQIRVAMNQGAVATNQVHIQVQSLQNDFIANTQPLMKELLLAAHKCRDYKDKGTPLPQCLTLRDSFGVFQNKYTRVATAFKDLEHIYHTESNAEWDLIQKAGEIQ